MARQPLRVTRGTAAQIRAYTGGPGEPVFNVESKRLHVQDGATSGGIPVARLDDLDAKVDKTGVAAVVAASTPAPTSWPTLTRAFGDNLDDVALSSGALRRLPGAVIRAAMTASNDRSGVFAVHLYGNSRDYGLITVSGDGTYRQSARAPHIVMQEALRLVYPNATVVNKGLPGKNMNEILAALRAAEIAGPLPQVIYLNAEAINGGIGNPISVADQQASLVAFIKICLRNGVALIMLQSALNAQSSAQSVAALARMNLQVARAYGIPTLDVDRQIGFGLDRYDVANSYDLGFHDSDAGYNRRYDDVALLMPTAGGPNGPRQVAPGTRWTHWDIGSHPGFTLTGDGSAPDGYSCLIKAGTSAVIAVECLADVVPVVHSVWGNPVFGPAKPILMPFQGGQSGVPTASGVHTLSSANRYFHGPRLPSGFRLFVIQATTQDLNIAAIEWIDPSRNVVVGGGRSRAIALPAGPPLGQGNAVPATAYDLGSPSLRKGGFLAYDRCRLPPLPVEYGWHFLERAVQTFDYDPVARKALLADGIIVSRKGDALNVRSVYQGAISADNLVADVFKGLLDCSVRFERVDGDLRVIVNGVVYGPFGSGSARLYPGLIAWGDAPGVDIGLGQAGYL